MEDRIGDEDLIDLLSFPSSSSPPVYPNLHFFSEKAGEVEGEQRSSSSSSTTRVPKIFDRFDDSSDDEFVSAGSGCGVETGLVQTAGKRLDYMIQFLDRKLSVSEDKDAERGFLPEFVASGGGDGIFKIPIRAAAHPGRPPSLELRPHPLTETQIGCFLRTIGCAVDNSKLWAGSECGVRFWNISDIYCGRAASRSGDGEAAIFHESVRTPATLCLITDPGNGVVWCGHKDGRIRCWKMDSSFDGNWIPFKECFSWQAHRDPVLSIVITSYGKLLEAKYPTLYWTPCAAHCLDLMLEDIFMLSNMKRAFTRAIGLTGYIYARTGVVDLMRKFTNNKELLRPAKTRFATAFITLSRIHEQKNSLKRMISSEEWVNSKWSKEAQGKKAVETILMPTFWNNVVFGLKVAGPLVRVLRLVDGEKKPPMGYIYEAMDRAKETIQRSFDNNENRYKEVFEIIDRRWNVQLHRPLHAAGYFLNLEFLYPNLDRIENDDEVLEGLYKCITRLVPKEEVQDKITEELSKYKRAEGLFGNPMAIRQRATRAPGDIWSGSEGGVIRIWPWEAIEKALSLTSGERHMASLLVERSYIDLRSQVTVSGACYGIFSADIKYMLSDHCGAKVWSAGYLSFALWDARTRELLKVFNLDGQVENMSGLPQDLTAVEDEMRLKFVSGGIMKPRDKSQYSINFFQRSRNALMGAADAVRRAAVKGAFGDDYRRTESLITTVDGKIWSGCANGLLVLWDGNGNRLQDFQYNSSAVHCLSTFGSRIWVGYASGTVQVLDLNGNLLGGWVAHNSPVIDMAVWGGYIFTLANHGGIRGWSITSPGPLDSIVRSELAGKEFLYTKLENLKILAGTWNVGQGRATHDSLISWIGSSAADVGIVVVGLQEVEMGAGFLAMSAARETVGLEGSSVGQWWIDMIGKTLDEGSTFVRVGSRQLAGLLITVWVRNDIRGHVGDVDVAAVPCGLGRAIGNKGAVGLRMRVYGRIMCFVNCHFAAHLEAVNRRNDDFDHVYRTMTFTRPSNPLNATAAGASSSIQMVRGANGMEGVPELGEADMVVFVGDFNYRLDGISYDEARDFISQRSFDWLRERDQLQAEMKAGNVFQGMREAVIGFPPTYKFERHQDGLAGYESGEKKRIPAWCDRILYRDSRSASISSCSLECPVVGSVLQYEACMDVTDSDHKPVRCILSVEIARVDESVRRQEFGEIIGCNEKIKCFLEELSNVPETIVSTNNIILQNEDTSILRITNKCGKDRALFEIICEGQSTINDGGQSSSSSDLCPRGSFGFPRWLEVNPAAGIIEAGHIAEISVHHYEYETSEEYVDGVPQNWWCEDARDKEVILVVKVMGGGGGPTTTRSHRVRVRHNKTIIINNNINNNDVMMGHNKRLINSQLPNNNNNNNNNNSSSSSNNNNNNSVLHRSDFQPFNCSSDVVHHLRNLHSP